eukprot:CAMPEP_0177578976 /NCGR_PEP_ID=MMETSP0419_2-20121207/675_1 /TAXON_ID=582737 /ORGANISM="Tetraselmis sp., Strain GSL018" /LENGTH=95 /DNA_ID=CAMNT_0019067535 /DNA_START=543 /DNA_END=831 /DNA_ORIENTATION=+
MESTTGAKEASEVLSAVMDDPVHDINGKRNVGVDLLKPRVAHKRKACDPKEGVIDVDHVVRAVRDATALVILAAEDERLKRGLVDPVQAPEDGQR